MSKKYESVTAILWRDGYHEAARTIESLAESLQSDVEMDWMKKFIRENSFDGEVIRDQLRSLWTAYCLHYDYYPDTLQYDSSMQELWAAVAETEPETADWHDLDSFDNFMCKFLV